MGLFSRPTVPPTESTKHSFVSVIQNEGNNTSRGFIAWRHPEKNFNTHSKLIVRQNEEAIFENGANDISVFPEMTECDLQTQNIAVIRSFREALSGGQSYFPCRVYFVSTREFNIPWGTVTPIRYMCPQLQRAVELRGGGIYTVRVCDSALFKKEILNDADSYSVDDLRDFFLERVYNNIGNIIANSLRNLQISSLEVTARKLELSQMCKHPINEMLLLKGLMLEDFTVDLDLDDDTLEAYKAESAHIIQAQGKVQELQTMGDAYNTIKGMEILENISLNPGSGGLANAGAGLGMGMAAGGAFVNIAQSVFSGIAAQQPQAPTTTSVGTNNRFESPNAGQQSTGGNNSYAARLTEIKNLFEQQLITQEDYDSMKRAILDEMKKI